MSREATELNISRVVSCPCTKQRPRAERVTVRWSTKSGANSSLPRLCSLSSCLPASCHGPSTSNCASTTAASSPARTRSARALEPRNRVSASTMMDLPAPVSPVSTFRPDSKWIATSRNRASPRMCRNESMRGSGSLSDWLAARLSTAIGQSCELPCAWGLALGRRNAKRA